MTITDDALRLFDVGNMPTVNPADRAGTIAHAFRAFHTANPWVYDALRTLALDMRRAGRERCGIKMLCEVVRWQYARATVGDEFRLNNNYTPHYARLLMDREPELAGMFDTREIRTP